MKNFYTDITGAIEFKDVAPAGFTLITDPDLKKQMWSNKYDERRIDGGLYYSDFQATLYIDILEGTYTSSQVFLFESHLSNLSNQIINGNWLTAQSVCDVLPLSGIFDVFKKTEIKDYIDDYVANNY